MAATTPGPRRLEGIVVSDKMQKTIVVRVTRLVRHPKYLKYMKISSRFKVHDETNQAKVGDKVLIRETRPMSRDKRWKLEKVLIAAAKMPAESES